MGLDGLELLLDIEEVFDLKISDDEACDVVTAGDLCALVAGKLRAKASQVCLSSAAFYALRRALMAELGVPRAAVRPSRSTASLLPAGQQRKAWERLERRLGLSLPRLEHPRWLARSIQAIAASAALTVLVVMGLAVARTLGFASFLCCGLLVALLVYVFSAVGLLKLTGDWASVVPACCVTVRGTAETLLRRNYGKIAARARAFNETEVWQIVRRMVAGKAAVPLDDVTRDARLVKDLGLG